MSSNGSWLQSDFLSWRRERHGRRDEGKEGDRAEEKERGKEGKKEEVRGGLKDRDACYSTQQPGFKPRTYMVGQENELL